MGVPMRYIEIKNYFEGLQVMGELLDTHKISIEKYKFNDSIQFSIRTALGIQNINGNFHGFFNEKSMIFSAHDFGKNDIRYYFPFTVNLDRYKNNVFIETTLPGLMKDRNNNILYHSKTQIKRMYENSLVFELKRKGFNNVKISDVRRGFVLNFELGLTQNHENIAEVYEIVKNNFTGVFEAIK